MLPGTVASQLSRIAFNPGRAVRVIRKLGIVGSGDVLHQKYWAALQSRGHLFDQIGVFSLEPGCRLNGLNYVYKQVVSNSLLPLDTLAEYGLLADDAAWVVATPSDYHVQYALQLAGRSRRVAIEKPVAASAREARLLLPLAERGGEIHVIDHKLFNAAPLAFIEQCRRQPAILESVRRIEGDFYETAGFATGRRQEDTLADIQYHLLTILVAIFKATSEEFEILIDRAQAASHDSNASDLFQAPKVWTASRITGRVLWKEMEIPFDLRQAKGAPRNEKSIRLVGKSGEMVREISLDESGSLAHGRVIDALLEPVVDMRHTLADAVGVMELIDASREMAEIDRAYPFGDLPVFIAEPALAA